MRIEFVRKLLGELLADSAIRQEDAILCVCAGEAERDVFHELGFTTVTISNLDTRLAPDSFRPYDWSFQDAQSLTFDDASFDVVFVADGLHHCSSPHRALTEMYRVARRTIIVVESRDNALMRLANRLDLSPEYELEAVIDNGFEYGGVDNGPVPNYIFRWTEDEFEKTLRSFDPTGPISCRYFYDLNLPYAAAGFRKTRLKYWVILLADIPLRLLLRVFKRQRNTLAMIATKPTQLHPWLNDTDGTVSFDRSYAADRFKTPPKESPQ